LVCSDPDPANSDYGRTERIGAESELVSPTLPVRLRVADLLAGAPDTTL
jgi:hypothetical protein